MALNWLSIMAATLTALLTGTPAESASGGPDLIVDRAAAAGSWTVSEEVFSGDSCELADRCIGGPGLRRLLRFDGSVINIGDQDLVLGSPEPNAVFELSACHQHYHVKNFMLLEILHPDTREPVWVNGAPAAGHKEAFCLRDDYLAYGAKDSSSFDCTYQGITAGWQDYYDRSLPCQWVDVTALASGRYLLRITVNPDRMLPETDYANNWVIVPVEIR